MRGTRPDRTDGIRRARHAAALARGRRFPRRTVRGRLIAGGITLLLIIIVVASGAVIGHHLGSRPSSPVSKPSARYTAVPVPPEATAMPGAAPSASAVPGPAPNALSTLTSDFDQLKNSLNAQVGVVVGAVGSNEDPIVLGDLQIGKAWSTMKVPLAIAALQEEHPPKVTDTMTAAITESDNAAAEKIWASLGDPDTAAQKVEGVLQQADDHTKVESHKVRPEFTAFGQSDWTLTNQVRLMSYAACQNSDVPILDLMGQVEPDQRWGVGAIANTRFKGGWGPSPTGQYLVRQMGVLTTPAGQTAVAVAAQPASGSFNDGTQDLTEISTWLERHLGALPGGQCSH